jgi:sugar lactone lactonase YvrE
MSSRGETGKSALARGGGKALAGPCLLLAAAIVLAAAAPARVKTIVDDATIKIAPQIAAKTVVKLALGTTLEVKGKKGEWFEVELDKDGEKVSGYIHEMLVKEVAEEPPAAPAVPGLAAEIRGGLDSARDLIRQERDLDQAVDKLDGLLAKAFAVDEAERRKSLAVEIYLWKGIARTDQGRDADGLAELRRMFDVDAAAAREATRNIATPKIVALLDLAEKQSRGLISEYTLEVATEPAGARVVVDGKDLGPTPGTFRLPSPQFVLEVEKAGYVPVREEVLLTSASARRTYALALATRDLALSSRPPGASVVLDGKATGLVTDCRLTGLAPGRHSLGLSKPLYLDWAGEFEIGGEENPELKVDLVGRSYVGAGLWAEGAVDAPSSLAADTRGFLYVLEAGPTRLEKLTPEGQTVPGWTSRAPELRDLKGPAALAVDGEGTIYIADEKRNAVLKVAPDGSSAVSWNGRGGGTSEFRGPSGVACDRAGNVYVAEAANNRVKKYSAAGEFLATWGAEGTADGRFQSPRALAVSVSGDVYVLDKNRVQRFSADGAFLGSIGGPGRTEGLFQDPQGLAVDGRDCVYVADAGSHLVQKFGPDGRFLCAWGGRGREEGKLWGPAGLLVDARGRVLVLERGNGRIQIFAVGSREETR